MLEHAENGDVMAKIWMYRGKTIEELKALSMEELLPLLPSRQRRTLQRGLTAVQKKLLVKIQKSSGKDKPIRTKARDMLILPSIVGAKLAIYDGKEFKQVIIQPEMVGHYLGEFALTRKRVTHGSPGFGATRASKFVPLK